MNNNSVNALCRAIYRILCPGVLSCMMLLVSGCVNTIEPDAVEDDAVVTLRVDEVFQEMAYIRLTHDGSQEDYWYSMLTQDTESDARTLIEGQIKSMLDADGQIAGNVGTNKNLTFEDLDAKTLYRVIAARITPGGKITGNVAVLDFVTLRDPDVFEQHPSWSIQYKERRAPENDPDHESEVLACNVLDDASEETYIPCLLTLKDFETTYKGNLRACFEDYIAFRNLEHVKWPSVVISGSYEHMEDRLRHGDYIAFMIGINAEGELTGYYAKTEFQLAQETASEAYRKWVGKWTLSGKCGDQKISYPVEISPDENNLYFRMSGYESTTAEAYQASVPQELPILLYFEKSTGDVYVVSEELPDLADAALAELYNFFLYGCVEIDYGGVPTVVPVDVPNVRIARISLVDDNHAEAKPETFIFDLNDVHYEVPFIYFNYSYMFGTYVNLVPVTMDSIVPRIDTITLER